MSLDVSLSYGESYVSKSFDVSDLDTQDILDLIEEMIDFLDIDGDDKEDDF